MYWPNSNSKNDPEIPGKIIAQMAIIPEMNITSREWFAAIGFRLTNMNVKTAPITANIMFLMLISLSFLNNITAEAIIRPKKNE